MGTVIPLWEPPSLPVAGNAERFPVRRIYCVGRNYAAHAREMGADPEREPPFFFTKPADALVQDGDPVPYPPQTAELHHEVELVVALRHGGRDIRPEAALDHVFGYAVGLDMTRRDLQQAAKEKGRPWDMAKGFDHSAPVGSLMPATTVGHPAAAAIRLSVNGTVRQQADIADMIWSVPETIAYLSGLVDLAPGDLIMTGTPEGVAAVVPGDLMVGEIAGIGTVRTPVVAR